MDISLKARMLSLFEFDLEEFKEQNRNVKYLVFKLKPNNQRAKAFINEYSTYEFALKKKQEFGEIIRFEYVHGQFLNDVKQFSFSTIYAILQILLLSIFQWHKKKQLARCISTSNIFLDQFEETIYPLEYGFQPELQQDKDKKDQKENYNPTRDAKLIIDIMQDLLTKIINKDNNYLSLKERIDKISDLMKQLPQQLHQQLPQNNNYNMFKQIYSNLYMLATNQPKQPTIEEIEQLYTDEWFQQMQVEIELKDFTRPLRDLDQDYEKLKYLKEVTDYLKNLNPQQFNFQKKQTQIGLMLVLQQILIKEVENQNLVNLDAEIKKELKLIKQQIDPTFSGLISIQQVDLDINALMHPYESHTKEVYKKIDDNQASPEELKLKFMLITTRLINKRDFNYQQYREIIQQGNIKEEIKRILKEIRLQSNF